MCVKYIIYSLPWFPPKLMMLTMKNKTWFSKLSLILLLYVIWSLLQAPTLAIKQVINKHYISISMHLPVKSCLFYIYIYACIFTINEVQKLICFFFFSSFWKFYSSACIFTIYKVQKLICFHFLHSEIVLYSVLRITCTRSRRFWGWFWSCDWFSLWLP